MYLEYVYFLNRQESNISVGVEIRVTQGQNAPNKTEKVHVLNQDLSGESDFDYQLQPVSHQNLKY